MAHYAKLGANNKVIAVHVVADSDCQNADGVEDEEVGRQFLERIHSWPLWKQTSYNDNIRKNFAGVGHTYDEDRDAFIAPKPFASWILNEETCQWDAPVVKPDDGQRYFWNEDTQQWDLND